jgi:hypothetical protein
MALVVISAAPCVCPSSSKLILRAVTHASISVAQIILCCSRSPEQTRV